MKKILLIVPMLLIAMVALTEKASAQTGNQSDVNVPILTNITSIPLGQSGTGSSTLSGQTSFNLPTISSPSIPNAVKLSDLNFASSNPLSPTIPIGGGVVTIIGGGDFIGGTSVFVVGPGSATITPI